MKLSVVSSFRTRICTPWSTRSSTSLVDYPLKRPQKRTHKPLGRVLRTRRLQWQTSSSQRQAQKCCDEVHYARGTSIEIHTCIYNTYRLFLSQRGGCTYKQLIGPLVVLIWRKLSAPSITSLPSATPITAVNAQIEFAERDGDLYRLKQALAFAELYEVATRTYKPY